jgi:transketolase
MLRVSAKENLTSKGGYIISACEGKPQATIIATGTEVSLAMEAQKILAEDKISVNVVSLPCWELFDAQSQTYRDEVLGTAPRVAVEAGVSFGWSRYVGSEDNVIGINSFGASGKGEEVYKHFGITVEGIVGKIKSLLK